MAPDAEFILRQVIEVEALPDPSQRIARKVELWPGVIGALRETCAENDRLRQIVYRTGHNLNEAHRD